MDGSVIPFLAATLDRFRRVFQRTPPPKPSQLTGEVAVSEPSRLSSLNALFS